MKQIKLTIILMAAGFMISGCGKTDAALSDYKKEMTDFTEEITMLVDSIDNIDLESENYTGELLSYLDEMDASFLKMSELDVPTQFANIEELADEASANMSEAVSLYHQALDIPEAYDENAADAALEYYNRAFKRIEYIGIILQGELPDDENVTIVDDSSDDDSDSDDDSNVDTESDSDAVG